MVCVGTKDVEEHQTLSDGPTGGTVSLKPDDRPRNQYPISKTILTQRTEPHAAHCEGFIPLVQELRRLSLEQKIVGGRKLSGKRRGG